MERFAKILVGTVAAGSLAVSAAPAMARDHDGGIGAGEVIAGALVIGGIAAVAAAASDNDRGRYSYNSRYRYDDRRYDRRYDDRRYRGNRYRGYRDNPRLAVERCVRAVERSASRYGRANVTQIRKVKRTGKGFDVKGSVVVNNRYRGRRGYDSGRFDCNYNYGRVVDVDFSGIRGLR
ncbi:hypothetical protein [Novosphingobium aquimarinum]|uniref:hypothetical protein n=1 Tax=Novosphingobium aquimarinum TaxID=2682494 RepID=UPI0012EC1DC2|nr:hypothetical protein [Novosphingobium aquimarinum]